MSEQNIVVGGHIIDTPYPVYICRANVGGNLHPGKLAYYNDRWSCFIGNGGSEQRFENYEVLLENPPSQWVPGPIDSQPIVVQTSEGGDVADGKEMSTKAKLENNGLLTTETYSKSRCNTEALRRHVVVVVYDTQGNAIWVSEDHACTTRCARLDFSCASSGTDAWLEKFPDAIGRYGATLDIIHSDDGLGQMVETVRRIIRDSNTIPKEIVDLAKQYWGT